MPENKLYTIKVSKIHGKGAFANCFIKEGAKIMQYLGEILDEAQANKRGLEYEAQAEISGDGSVYIFELDDNLYIDGNFEYNDAKYVNHSCQTNCESVQEGNDIFFYATTDIQAGEELLINYGYALEHFLDHKCRCGAPNCCGYIVSEADRPKLRKILQNKYRRNNSNSIMPKQ